VCPTLELKQGTGVAEGVEQLVASLQVLEDAKECLAKEAAEGGEGRENEGGREREGEEEGMSEGGGIGPSPQQIKQEQGKNQQQQQQQQQEQGQELQQQQQQQEQGQKQQQQQQQQLQWQQDAAAQGWCARIAVAAYMLGPQSSFVRRCVGLRSLTLLLPLLLKSV